MSKKTWVKVKVGLVRDPKHRQALGEQSAIWLYLWLIDHADWETGVVSPYKDTDAAEELAASVPWIRKRRRQLEELGYIQSEQRGPYGLAITLVKWVNPRSYDGLVLNDEAESDLESDPNRSLSNEAKSDTPGEGDTLRDRDSDAPGERDPKSDPNRSLSNGMKSDTESDMESDTDRTNKRITPSLDSESRSQDSGERKPIPQPTPEHPPPDEKPKVTHRHPVIQAYREAAHVYPPKGWYEDVAGIVGEDPERVARFQAHVKAWVGKGWKPTNVKGILESFQKALPTTQPHNGGQTTVRRVKSRTPPADPPDAPPEAIQTWQTTYQELQLQMPRETFDAWLRPSRLLRVADQNGTRVYHVGVQSDAACEWLEHRLKKVVVRALTSVARQPVDVSFEVVSREGAPS